MKTIEERVWHVLYKRIEAEEDDTGYICKYVCDGKETECQCYSVYEN